MLYFMVLLIFGANAVEQVNKTENYFFYNSTELEIAESFGALLCRWELGQCYVECGSVNLTTHIMSLNNSISLVKNITLTNQSRVIVINITGEETTCNVTKCESAKISALIYNLSTSNDLKDLKRPAHIRMMCSELFASDNAIKKVYIRAEKEYINALISLDFYGTTKNYDFEEFNMIVIKMDKKNTTGMGHVQISAPKVSGDDLPLNVFIPTEPFMTSSVEQQKVGIMTYPSAELFKVNTVLKSKVIRVETVGHNITHLSKQLVINFTLNSEIISENYTLSCRFYDVNAKPGKEGWDDMGSFTSLENFNSSHTVTCSYNHMTPFAVLLVNVTQIDPQQWKILSYISYIGCSLSTLFSAVTIFLYTFMKSLNRDNSIRIHLSLSVAVFLLNISFLFIEWAATWSQDSMCVLIAVIIQYSLLSCFSWMAIEAIHLYLLLIKVFNTYIKHYMVKLSLFGWGVPAVLVGGSLCAFGSKPFYGTTQINLSNTNETTQICWITDTRFLYGMNISYFSVMFLFNTCILTTVTRQIFKLRCLKTKHSKLPSRKDLCTVLGLTLLLGMTWGLAFFTSGYTNYPILYLFCICNTLQGLFLFLWFYGTVRKNKRLMAPTSSVSEPTTTTMQSSFM